MSILSGKFMYIRLHFHFLNADVSVSNAILDRLHVKHAVTIRFSGESAKQQSHLQTHKCGEGCSSPVAKGVTKYAC